MKSIEFNANYSPIEKEVAERSILIKNMLEDIGDQNVGESIPIPNVQFQFIMCKQTGLLTPVLGQRSCLEKGYRMVHPPPW